MSDWKFLNKHRVLPKHDSTYGSTAADGFNGVFEIKINGLIVRVIASDGLGWQHVSVSICNSLHAPSWSVMCQVKDLFWEPEDAVMQLHPPRSIWVNQHPGCLHLWRPVLPGVYIPLPAPYLVGSEFEKGGSTLMKPPEPA